MKKETATRTTEKAKQAEPDFVKRLRSESEELTSRIGKLLCFMDSPAIGKLSPDMVKLMQAQYYAMTAYRIILGMRLELLGKEGAK